ncbi:M24 family metallopeptidase [Galbibacter sp. PAP.153]|uniref:M24 family metallopeptidase n=1 Tax=Galbibacter sp. PAP.153 TaxID=3104623 RepID=UPI00300A9DB3
MSTLLGVDVNGVPSGMSPELVHAIVSQREIKSSDEVDGLEEALGTTKKMHENVMRQAAPGKTETYLMGLVEQTALSKGARTAYSPIVSVRGEILHNFNYGNTLREGQLLLGDFGALMPSGYTGDITRTIPTSGTFSTQQKEVYQIVLNAQERAVQMLQPGTLFKAVHLAACTEIVEGLTNLGLMRGNAEAAVEAGAHTLFYPHGLGHMIGLDVHDMENLGEEYVGYDTTVKKSKEFGLKSLRLGKSLKQGFVVTIEPGIYFIPELFHHWKSTNHPCSEFLNYDKISSYLDFGGIRIEDEYLVHEDGGRLLGAPIPKQVQEVEDIMSS